MQWSKEVFAQNLAYYLEASGKTQRDVATDLGVGTATMSEWINGKKFPRIDKIEMLANYFGIEKSDLIEAHEKDDVTEQKKIAKKLWLDTFPDVIWTEAEMKEILDFSAYVLSKRKK